jgi:hypothetical protein
MNKNNKITKLFGLLLFFPIFISLELKAEEVNQLDIQKVALNAFSRYSEMPQSELQIVQIIPVIQRDTACFYIFNFDRGFIIVAADDVSIPIIGYDLENTIDINNMPPAVSYLFEGYKEEIGLAKRMRPETSSEIKKQWEDLLGDDRGGAIGESGGLGGIISFPSADPLYYTPGTWLIETKWGQSGGNASGSTTTYNHYCPEIGGTKTKVGCGGVAVAQILNYYSCHNNPKDILTYDPPTGTITINFANESYYWSNMSINCATLENAKLLYHSAAAVKSTFGVSNTSSFVSNIQSSFSYFDFGTTVRMDKNNYPNEANWKNLLKNEIDKRRPIIYFGKSENVGSGSHFWVIDGYSVDNNNNVNQFHCNWGWRGSSNGFYTLSNLTNVGGFDYSKDQLAITMIAAKKNPTAYINHTFPCGTVYAYSFRLLDCKVATNVAEAAVLNMQCSTEIFGTFEVPLGSVFEIQIP